MSRDSDHFLGYFSPELARYVHDPDLFARRLAGIVLIRRPTSKTRVA